MTAAAISGTFSTYRHVPSRGIVQIVVEIPVEAQAAAFEALGYPEPGKSIHVAVARLNATAEPTPPLGDGAYQIGLRYRLRDGKTYICEENGLREVAEGHEAASGDAAAPTSPVVPEGGENRGVLPTSKLDPPMPPGAGVPASVTNVCDYCGDTGHSAGKCPKARYAAMDDMAKARVRASLLAKDMRFHAWIGIEGSYESCVAVAANSIRRDCLVKSRSEIATDYDAYLRFLSLENRYRIAVGLAPEPRE